MAQSNEVTIQKIIDVLTDIKVEKRKGFILLPSIPGFDLYEIDADRLEMYLKLESMHNKVMNKTKQSKNEV